MPSYLLNIEDADVEASVALGRMRSADLTVAALPFAERFVSLWRKGAPDPDMDAETLLGVFQVRSFHAETSLNTVQRFRVHGPLSRELEL